jgi:hypothetical protein
VPRLLAYAAIYRLGRRRAIEIVAKLEPGETISRRYEMGNTNIAPKVAVPSSRRTKRNDSAAPHAQEVREIGVKSARGESMKIELDPTLETLFKSYFGTDGLGFVEMMLSSIVSASGEGDLSGADVFRAVQAIRAIGPRDEIEGILATQMVTTHFAAMDTLSRLKISRDTVQQDSNGNLAVKLLRTFTMQLEALQRYRGKGQQEVKVEHVHVNAGGKAIVGSVKPRGKNHEDPKAQGDKPPEITHEPGAPMRSPNPEREALPIAGSPREAPMQDAWRSNRKRCSNR